VLTALLADAAPAAAAAAAAPAAKATAAAVQLTPQMLQNLQGLKYQAQTPLQQHAPWLTHIFAGLFIIAAVSMVFLLAVQTTKQEGLSGTIGGRVDSNYRGRLGFDGQLARITGGVAVAFVVIATIVSLSGI
jgi:preprotein translocase subunit SecG